MIQNNSKQLEKAHSSFPIHQRTCTGIFSLLLSIWIPVFASRSIVAETSSPDSFQPASIEKIQLYQPRFDRKRPVIAIVGENEYTELTDYIVPYSILKESGAAEVFALSTKPGTIRMFPSLQIEVQNTISRFDSLFPEGADYVIVPAVHNSENPDLLQWIQTQASKGATIVGICDGAWVLANAGLLKGHRATGHWYSFDKLEAKFTDTKWIRNRRYVADGKIITTTGITASIPISLALVETIAGKQSADLVAKKFGETDWSSTHTSSDFQLGARNIFTAAKNLLAFWFYEDVGIPVSQDMDELTLALVADAYSRTYKTKAFSISENNEPVRTKRGLVLIPDKIKTSSDLPDRILGNIGEQPAVPTLNQTLKDIESLYGLDTANFVALQMEYKRK